MQYVPLSCQRALFELPAELHYLNCAYMSPLARPVAESGHRGIDRKLVPSCIGPLDFFEDGERIRQRFGRLVHADPSRVAIVPSASYALATAAHNTPVARGQNIVLTAEQFPSNVYIWHRLASQAGAELRVVGPPDARVGRGSGWSRRLIETIDTRTAVVALPHVHWTDGTRFDLEAIGGRAREAGAAFIVDGTQSVGALPFDVRVIAPDALVCAAYKWLMGPYSIGVTYFGPRYDGGEPLEENWISRLGSEDFRGLVTYQQEYQPGASRFDVGERSNFILVPMLAAALDVVLGWTPAGVQDYCRALTTEPLAELGDLGFEVEDAGWRGAHLFGLRLPPGLDLDRLQTQLTGRQIHVSLRGSALRVSPHVYNTPDDVGALVEVLRAAATGFRTPSSA